MAVGRGAVGDRSREPGPEIGRVSVGFSDRLTKTFRKQEPQGCGRVLGCQSAAVAGFVDCHCSISVRGRQHLCAVPGLCWLSITGIVGGSAIAIEGPPWLGAATAVAGLLTGFAALKLFWETAPNRGSTRLLLAILGIETAWLIVSALRLGLAITARGVEVSPTQALALSVAGALTVAVGFFPSGLGLREALIAGLSPLIGLEFDIGVLIGSIDRLIWLLFLAAASGALVLRGSGSDKDAVSEAER